MIKLRDLFLSTVLCLSATAFADQRFEATLTGHAILPAFTMVLPPADAPRDALVSGKFAGPGNIRVDTPGSIMGDTGAMHGNRQTGIAFPFIGQPVQGFSGISRWRMSLAIIGCSPITGLVIAATALMPC